MTAAEQDRWGQINVLAETDALMARIVYIMRNRGLQTPLEIVLEGLCGYAQVVAFLRAQLVEAESMCPRIYYINTNGSQVHE